MHRTQQALAPAAKVAIAQTAPAAVAAAPKATPTVVMATLNTVLHLKRPERADVPMGSVAAKRAAVIVAAQKVSRAAAPTACVIVRKARATALPAGNLIVVAVAKRRVPVATDMRAKRNLKARPADADPVAALARPESPAAAAVRMARGNSSLGEFPYFPAGRRVRRFLCRESALFAGNFP